MAVQPGGTLVLNGSFHSTLDGSVVDAATTTWPSGAPGGSSIDSGGLIDFEAGGFHVIERNPDTHVVKAVATEDGATACATYGVQSPCLPLRVQHQAVSRLITVREWTASLKGGVQVEVVAPPAYAPVTSFAARMQPVMIGGGIVLAVVAALLTAWMVYRRWAKSARVQLVQLAGRVRDKAGRADPILAGTLKPALDSALRAVRERKFDPESAEGKRVAEVLRQVDARLDAKVARVRAEDEKRTADELVEQVEIALEAAGEAAEIGRART